MEKKHRVNKELLNAIREEVVTSFEIEEIKKMSFNSFFDDVEVNNAYEEEWNPRAYRRYYRMIFKEITGV